MYSPTLLLGLGETGRLIANNSLDYINSIDKIVFDNLVIDYSIGSDKIFVSKKESGIPEINCNFLKSNYNTENNVFKDNYNGILDIEYEFQDRLKFITTLLKQEGKRQLFIEKGLSPDLQIIVLSSTFDFIGSSIVTPILKFIRNANITNKIDLILMLPFEDKERDINERNIEKIRTYATFCELDSQLTRNTNLARMVHVVEMINENNTFLQSSKELLSKVPEFVYQYISNRINVNNNILNQLNEPVPNTNKLKRYSSFGSSKIYYPKNKTFEGIEALSQLEVFRHIIENIKHCRFDDQAVGAEIKTFIYTNGFYNLTDKLKVDDKENKIYEDFRTNIIPNESTNVDKLIYDSKLLSTDYNSRTFNLILNKLSDRYSNLVKTTKDSLKVFALNCIDTKNKSLAYTIAFLSMFLNQKNDKYLYSKDIGIQENWETIYSKLKEYYNKKLALPTKESQAQEYNVKITNNLKLLTEKELRCSELNEIINNSKGVIEKESVETLNIDNAKTELDSILKDTKEKQKELKELNKKYQEINKEINNFNQKIDDVNFRNEIMSKDINKADDCIDGYEKALRENENLLSKCRENIDRLIKVAKTKIIWLTIVFPIIIVLLYIISIFFFPVFGLLYYFYSFIPVAIAYSIFAYLKYNRDIGNELNIEKSKRIALVTQKKNSINQYNDAINYRFYIEFEHRLNSYAIEWGKQIKEEASDILNKLSSFCNDIVTKYSEKKDFYDNKLIFEDDIFVKSIIKKQDILRFFDEKENYIKDFFAKNDVGPLSKFVEIFLDGKESNPLFELEITLDEYLRTIFNDLSNKSVYDFIFKDNFIKNNPPIDTKLELLKSSSAPFVCLKEENISNKSDLLTSLFVEDKANDFTEEIKNILSHKGVKNLFVFSTDNKTEINLVNLRVGFAAYQISSMEDYKITLKNKDEAFILNNYTIEESYASYDLFPSYIERIINNKDFEVILWARILDIIKIKDKSYCYNSRTLGTNLDDCFRYFMSVKGEEDLVNVKNDINKGKDNFTREKEGNSLRLKTQDYIDNNPDNLSKYVLRKIENFSSIDREV